MLIFDDNNPSANVQMDLGQSSQLEHSYWEQHVKEQEFRREIGEWFNYYQVVLIRQLIGKMKLKYRNDKQFVDYFSNVSLEKLCDVFNYAIARGHAIGFAWALHEPVRLHLRDFGKFAFYHEVFFWYQSSLINKEVIYKNMEHDAVSLYLNWIDDYCEDYYMIVMTILKAFFFKGFITAMHDIQHRYRIPDQPCNHSILSQLPVNYDVEMTPAFYGRYESGTDYTELWSLHWSPCYGYYTNDNRHFYKLYNNKIAMMQVSLTNLDHLQLDIVDGVQNAKDNLDLLNKQHFHANQQIVVIELIINAIANDVESMVRPVDAGEKYVLGHSLRKKFSKQLKVPFANCIVKGWY